MDWRLVFYFTGAICSATLSHVSKDLLQVEHDPIMGRWTETRKTIKILNRQRQNSLILVGPAGCGKTSIVELLAMKMKAKQIPDSLQNTALRELDLGQLSDKNDALSGLLSTLDMKTNLVLFIDEIHTLFDKKYIGFMSKLSKIVEFGKLRLIGATTDIEFRKYMSKHSSILNRFKIVQVEEPTVQRSISILRASKERFEKHHELEILDSAIVSSVKESRQYIKDMSDPAKSIETLDSACAIVKLMNIKSKDKEVHRLESIIRDKRNANLPFTEEKNFLKKSKKKFEKRTCVISKDVREAIAERTGIDITKLDKNVDKDLTKIPKEIQGRVRGQDEACLKIGNSVMRNLSGIGDRKKPIGSFLLAGTTGTGKTELAKSVASVMGISLFTLDMSEYQSSHDISQLIGSPPGYVGSLEGGVLTEAIRRKPNQVILFDEIEKADKSILNILLQILDEGRLTDSRGILIDFTNTVIIITTNLGDKDLLEIDYNKQVSKKELEEKREMAMKRISGYFRPEILNRFDSIVFFNVLSDEDVKFIVRMFIGKLSERTKFRNDKIDLIAHESTEDLLVKLGYQNKGNGARPIKNLVEKYITAAISLLIRTKVVTKNCTVWVFDKDCEKMPKFKGSKRAKKHVFADLFAFFVEYHSDQ